MDQLIFRFNFHRPPYHNLNLTDSGVLYINDTVDLEKECLGIFDNARVLLPVLQEDCVNVVLVFDASAHEELS